MKIKKKVLLAIFDGFGIGKNDKHSNAFAFANTPTFDYLFKNYLYSNIEASGKYVGLPENQMGNSEVGHLTLGIGRIEKQSLYLINHEIKNGLFFKNPELINAFKHSIKYNSTVHLIGLASDGGIHSHINHLYALIDYSIKNNVKCCIDLITDGRDTDRKAALNLISTLVDYLKKHNINNNVFIGSISGRFYAMDRDKRWDRINKTVDVLFNDKYSETFSNVIDYINKSYKNNNFDEFIYPAYSSKYDSKIKDNDTIIFYNFRQDRAIQLASTLTNKNYINKLKYNVSNLYVLTFRHYSDSVISKVMYPYNKIINCAGEYLSKKGYKQLRIAETEKYAHVTYFFDGGVEIKYPNTDYLLIDSPKVKTYDLKPEMSAGEITNNLLPLIGIYDFIVLNYANFDMVGHTGNFNATVKAIEFLDKCIKRVYEKCLEKDVLLVITADHGNAEKMLNSDGSICKTHTNNKIPLCFVTSDYIFNINNFYVPSLQDIIPTIFNIINIGVPSEMTGVNLLKIKDKYDK